MNGYDLWDIFDYSLNERKRDEYKSAKKKLNKYKENLDEYIEKCKYNIQGFSDIYFENVNIYGEAIDLFCEKSEKSHKDIKSYIDRLELISSIIGKRRDKAQELYSYYLRQCEIEDENERRKWEEENA